jgi:maltose-binding protein MalE
MDMFQKYGIEAPPKTLSDLDNIAATLTKNGVTPMVHGYQTEPGWFVNVITDWLLNSMTPADYQTFWTAYGPDLKTSNFGSRAIKWTDDQIVSAFQIAQDWGKNILAQGTVSMTDAAAVSAFTGQTAGMYMVGSWGATGLEQPVGSSFKYGFWPITSPPTNGGGKQRMVLFAQTYVVMAKTKSPNLCADYLNEFFSVPSQLEFLNTQGLFPAIPLSGSVVSDPILQNLLNVANNLDYGYSLYGSVATELQQPLENAIASVLTGQATPAQACQTMENTAVSVNQRGS